ncbi:MAG: hypothetical protein HUJ93_06720, partial [Bacteroidales bacterium]|nr:hypothetical protein [Bacteroidales bacterium]
MNRVFLSIYRYFRGHKTLLWSLLAGIVLCCAAAASRISFVEDISSFFPQKEESRRLDNAFQHIGSENRIVINLRGDDPDQL